MADADFDGITNPNRVADKRMKKAEGVDAGEIGKSYADTFGKPQMSQPDFSGYRANGPKGGPPASMLKKRASKE
jgi:hypothetical protein